MFNFEFSDKVTTVAGSTQGYKDGYGTDAHFQHVAGILLDPDLQMLYIADSVRFHYFLRFKYFFRLIDIRTRSYNTYILTYII